MHLGRLNNYILTAFLLIIVISSTIPTTARAESEGRSQASAVTHGGDGGEHEKSNVFKGFLDLGIWTIVVFLVLLFVLGKYAWKPMLQGLEQREHSIQSAMEEAKKAKEEALALRNQLAEEAAKAQDKVRQVIDQARRDAEK